MFGPLVTPALATVRFVAPLSSEIASTADSVIAAIPAMAPTSLTEIPMAPFHRATRKPVRFTWLEPYEAKL